MDSVIHKHALLRLREDTRFLPLNYIALVLCVPHDVDRKWLHLLGTVAIWMATMYEKGRRTPPIYTILYADGHISKELYPLISRQD